MKIIVTGATGTAGAEVIRQALLCDAIEQVTALSRKPPDMQHPKLKVVIHADFNNYQGLEEVLSGHDACIWCLGISQTQVNKEQYEQITYNYTLAGAKAMIIANPGMSFVFLSGQGADTTEKSRTIFARIKGKTENALCRLKFRRLYMARPGGIWPVHTNPNMAPVNKRMLPFFPLLNLLFPFTVIKADILARAMLRLALEGSEAKVLSNNQLKKLGKEPFI